MMKAKLADSVGTRFRLHPAPLIEDEYGRRELQDVFIVERLEGEGLRFCGITSSRVFTLGFDHVIERLSNPVAQPLLYGEAILKLKSRVVFGRDGVRYELLDRTSQRPAKRPRARRKRQSRSNLQPSVGWNALPSKVLSIGTPSHSSESGAAGLIALAILAVIVVAAFGSSSA